MTLQEFRGSEIQVLKREPLFVPYQIAYEISLTSKRNQSVSPVFGGPKVHPDGLDLNDKNYLFFPDSQRQTWNVRGIRIPKHPATPDSTTQPMDIVASSQEKPKQSLFEEFVNKQKISTTNITRSGSLMAFVKK